ncbi:MAG: PKD domain-containing protein [Saprospiraceae bacterium]|nr:PKD domain-containing protein [Saprospiraceae bacterium]
MNTANDLGNPGPDFKFGWGHVNAYRAYKLLESKRYLTDKIDLNEIHTKEITVDDNTKEVRFMLYWADIEPSIISKIALVNNLDLKVITPSGKELYPWVLDTTPKAANLNMPATFGIDNLNNVEQVLISYPETGTYKIIINGKSIPFGPQKYFLTHEIIPISDVAITYPIGGESLVPNDKIGIFWDAKEDGQYNLSYSTNDKASWTPIGSSTGSSRYMDWVVPSVISGKVWLKISGVNGSFETKAPLSIMPVPTNIKVDKVCIDSMSISWNKVTGADFYTIHYLNEKYMDSIGISNTNSFTIPIKNPVAENWFSVSANNFENITGRRAIAVLYNSGLKSCPQAFDAGVTNILSPISTKFSCSNIEDSVKISIKNNGNNVISNFVVSYQLNNESPITEEITDTIKVGSSYVYTFKTPVQISTSGENVIKTWIKLQDDIVFYNDTLNTKVKFFIFKNNIQYNSSENFESSNFPPDNWIIDNNDITTWSRINCIGSDGNPTNAAYINTYNYKNKTIGARDRLYLPTITIPDTANTPYISFDLSNIRKNTSTSDSLLIHVYENCNNKLLNTIFKKSSYTMASAQNSLQNWIPTAKEHWRNYALDLTEFKGKSVIIVFESVNGNSNNIYIDNINFANNLLVAPIADFNFDKTEGCLNADTVTITPNIIAGNSLNYLWNFGFGGSPSSTSQLIGPHKIKWLSAGVKNITLTVYNGLDTIVITKSLTIKPSPVSSFSNLNNGNTVDFTNTSTNANSYLWEFGDGTTSTDINPTHTYLSTGTYYVSLTSEGLCGTSKITKAIVLTTPNKEVSDVVQCNLFPKVATNEVFLQIEKSKSNKIQNELFDINGKLIRKFEFENSGEKTSYKLTISDLANVFYLVKTKINDQIFTNNFIKQ